MVRGFRFGNGPVAVSLLADATPTNPWDHAYYTIWSATYRLLGRTTLGSTASSGG